MQIHSISLQASAGGTSAKVDISSTSAQSAAYNARTLLVSPSIDCFYRSGSNPTALADGTDTFLFGGNTYRIEGLPAQHKLAFITSAASGSVYITPEP